MVHFQAKSKNIQRISKEALPERLVRDGIRHGWYYALPIVLFVYLIGVLKWSPQISVVYGWLLLMVLGIFSKRDRITWYSMQSALQLAIRVITSFGPVFFYIGIIFASLQMTGMTYRFTSMITSWAGGNQVLLLIMAGGAAFLFGSGMPLLAMYFVLAALIGPALIQSGLNPLAAHLFIIYALHTHTLTPPVMSAVVFTSAIAKSNVWGTSWSAMRLATAMFIAPLIVVYNPALLLQGDYPVTEILKPLLPCIVAMIVLPAGIQGWFVSRASWLQRIILISSGFLLIATFVNIWLGIIGAVLVLLVLIWQGITPAWVLKKLRGSMFGKQ